MFGFIPAWAMWAGLGWTAKTAVEKVASTHVPPPAGTPGQVGAPQQPAGPPRAPLYDKHMPPDYERAVANAILRRDSAYLRAFAGTLSPCVELNTDFPIAAWALHQRAAALDAAFAAVPRPAPPPAQVQATPPPQPAPPAPAPAPSPAPVAASKPNGAPAGQAPIAVVPDVAPRAEG